MEVTFFISSASRAAGVMQYDDIPTEPIGEPLSMTSTQPLVALAQAVGGEARGAGSLRPLRDATCQSYPIVHFEPTVVRALASLKDSEIDPVAGQWLELANWEDGEIDLYELSQCVEELRAGLGRVRDLGERLYILLEEKAW
ncbi:MAG: hypothetical protein QF570_01950 [Myxococcota bacterium]|jgi:hypothetical protein|nr:hypothetical protein [Myxococcota bacterium]